MAAGKVVASPHDDLYKWGLLLALALGSAGLWLIWVALFGSEAAVEKAGDGVGSHEAAIVIIAIAFPIAWFIRRLKRPH